MRFFLWPGEELVSSHVQREAHLTPEAAALHKLGAIDSSWMLARELHGDEWMRVWTHSSGGTLDLRVQGRVHGSAAEILSILREVDLLPLWNRYCDGADLRRLVAPNDMWAAAGVRLPWPVPAQALLVHAQARKDPLANGLVALAQSPSAAMPAPEGVVLPASLRGRLPLLVDLAVGRLRAESGTQRTSTRVDVYLSFVLADMGFHVEAAPVWITNIIVYIVAPVIWHSYTQALGSIHAKGSPHAARLKADASGLYARVVRWTGQPRLSAHSSDGKLLDPQQEPSRTVAAKSDKRWWQVPWKRMRIRSTG